jgi:VWFA-related protein
VPRIAALFIACPLLAQGPDLTTTVRLVVAPTTVADRSGHYVNGLTEQDFQVYDNGRRVNAHVDVSFVPISLVITVQASEFSAEALNKVRRIGNLIEPLVTGERGEVALVAFDSEVQVLQAFTADDTMLRAALLHLVPGDDGGRMIDAVAGSVRLLATRPPARRRVLLVISETRDRGSKHKLAEVLTETQRQNVTIYPLTYSAYTTAFTAKPGTTPPPSGGAGFNLIAIFREIGRLGKARAAEAFSTYTGGRRLSFTRQRGLEEAVARIGEELHSQYLVSFEAAPDARAEFHAIEVRIAGRPDVTVRTRPGYWAAAP